MIAFRHDPAFLWIMGNTVMLVPDTSFLPKVVTEFHLHSEVHLPTFYPNPSTEDEWHLHGLDVRQTLLFCLHRLKLNRKDPNLFVFYIGHNMG